MEHDSEFLTLVVRPVNDGNRAVISDDARIRPINFRRKTQVLAIKQEDSAGFRTTVLPVRLVSGGGNVLPLSGEVTGCVWYRRRT